MNQEPKTREEIREILKDVKFKNHEFLLIQDHYRFLLQIRYMDKCVETGEWKEQKGRKWLISPFATKSEIVQTAFKAIMTSQEHVAREFFTYRGKNVFGPHFDVDALWEICDSENLDIRS